MTESQLFKCFNLFDFFGFLIEIKKVWKSVSRNAICVVEKNIWNKLTASILKKNKSTADTEKE